jgi:hypothetical protein
MAAGYGASPQTLTPMPYQIIDAVMARAIEADAEQTHPLFAWIIMRDGQNARNTRISAVRGQSRNDAIHFSNKTNRLLFCMPENASS